MDVAMERVPATASSASDDQADDALLQLQGRLHRWAVDQHQVPENRVPQPCARPYTLHPQPSTLNPLNSEPYTSEDEYPTP